MKKYLNPFRLATYLLVLFCCGHTYGAMVATPHFSAPADAVLSAMKSVRFEAHGSEGSWYGFYLGFGYMVSIFFLFSACVTWFLGGLDLRRQRALAPLVHALFISFVVNTVIAARWFFLPPVVFSSLITALLGLQSLRLATARGVPSDWLSSPPEPSRSS